VLTVEKPIRMALFALSLVAMGCHAQVPSKEAGTLSPEMARRVSVLLRAKTQVPPDYQIVVGSRSKSEVPDFDEIQVTFVADGKSSKPMAFLLSKDGKTLAQFNKFDISQDPKNLVSGANRPFRGGPENAPVLIVGFDDLECPYCAKMHAQLFPALLKRYKDQVRVVYRDFPEDQHPWAMRAAIDVNCLAAQSPEGYWKLVDYIHLHMTEMGGDEKSLVKANSMLDGLTVDEGKRQKADVTALNACIAKQEDTAVKASMKQGEALGVDATPALFINGEKFQGAYPIEYVYRVIDEALRAAGQTPPPPESIPTENSAPVNSSSPVAKPGS
jgi:protein-disulfide isomerase